MYWMNIQAPPGETRDKSERQSGIERQRKRGAPPPTKTKETEREGVFVS